MGTRNYWNAEEKENQQLDSGGPNPNQKVFTYKGNEIRCLDFASHVLEFKDLTGRHTTNK